MRSVAISINDIASLTSTGRIDLAGQVADAVNHLGDTGYLETAFAVDGGAYSVQGKGTTAQLTVQSYSDIQARYHYVDSDGQDQYINLPDLSKTLVNDTDTVPVLPTTQADMSTLDQNLIPDGYEMVDGYTVLAADGQTPGQAVSGAVVNHNMNGDIIQYELQSQYTVTFEYVDDATGTVTPGTTVRAPAGQQVTYDLDVPTGYTLATKQDTGVNINGNELDYTMTPVATTTVQIHIIPAKETGTATTTRTITYKVAGDAFAAPTAVTQTMEWTTTKDLVTGVITAVPQGNFASVDSPYVPATTVDGVQTAWRPDVATVPGVTLAEQTGMPEDADDVIVTYQPYAEVDTAPAVQTKSQVGEPLHAVATTMQYVDDVTGEQVGTTTTHVGEPGRTFDWMAVVPTNYRLADGQAASGTYTFAETDNAPVVIHLTHQVVDGQTETTRTITYKVEGDAFTAPAPVTQTVTWKTATDLVTGDVVATPAGNFTSVTSPYAPATTNDGVQTSWQPDVATVAGIELTPVMGTPTDPASVTVTYRPYAQIDTVETTPQTKTQVGEPLHAVATTVSYLDDVTGEQVGTATTHVGEPGRTFDWTATVPASYRLADGQAASGTYTFAETDNVPVVIHLTHQVVDGQTETTRTITYKVEGDAFTAPAPVTQTVTWKTATDLVTGDVVATPAGNFASVTSPYAPATTSDGVQTSWQPDVVTVEGIKLTPVTGTPTDPDNVTVTYRPYAQIDTTGTTPEAKTQVGEPLHAVQPRSVTWTTSPANKLVPLQPRLVSRDGPSTGRRRYQPTTVWQMVRRLVGRTPLLKRATHPSSST
ncbi:hypothetical protein [Lacticaseibacillus thailandensis]|uniref:hypothetical protein n=1 Tax=Lacticaseibacillus thailandensis TaxID=381741 RepID=UPI0006D22768